MRSRGGWPAALAGLALLSAAVIVCAMLTMGGSSARRVELAGLSYANLASHASLDNGPKQDYQNDFPASYFLAAPNPNAKYAWVCPGPSRLDDAHSSACPGSGTGGFRCCVDIESGGAVTDNMCCPKHEKQLAVGSEGPSTAALERKIESILTNIVTKMEKDAIPKPQPEPHNYISSGAADRDLDSYFDKLSDKPEKTRSMATLQAKNDLNKFFSVLGDGQLGGLAPKPKKHKVVKPQLPDASPEIRQYAEKLAFKMKAQMETEDEKREEAEFKAWRHESIGHKRRPSRTQRAALEQKKQQERARRAGEETARQWNTAANQEHYFTDVRGPVSDAFLRAYNPSRLAGFEHEDGEVDVPEADVH